MSNTISKRKEYLKADGSIYGFIVFIMVAIITFILLGGI